MKTIAALMLMVASHATLAQGYVGDTWAQIKATSQGTISLAYVETPGFAYKDGSGKLTGICIDIMNDFVAWINANKGVKLQSKFVGDGSNFQGMYAKVKASTGGYSGLEILP